MASVLRAPSLRGIPGQPCLTTILSQTPKPLCVSFARTADFRFSCLSSFRFSKSKSLRFMEVVSFASHGETETADTEEILEPEIEDVSDSAVGVEDVTSDDEVTGAEETQTSGTEVLIQSLKEALENNDEPKVAEIEAYLKSIIDDKVNLEMKVATLSDELSISKDRILRISADFDNFRKRTERDRNSLVTNAQGEVVENFLAVLDNFERAKSQIKVETEGEEKINNSYQSIYKQFLEILGSLGVAAVETVGNPFDPTVNYRVGSKFRRVLDELFRNVLKFVQLHEAIMREDSDEFEEGIILQEFRKGFKLGDRLLRPSMVKVSAGPGPAKPKQEPSEEAEAGSVTSETEGVSESSEGNTEPESA